MTAPIQPDLRKPARWFQKEGKQKETNQKTEESHPGCRRRAEAPQGNGVHLMNASGLENGNGRGEAKGSDEGHGGTVRRKEKEQSCSLGQIFLLLYQILSQSTGVC